jgi:radical SAM superfamily enzyme YgiQ (UPF0313 family)
LSSVFGPFGVDDEYGREANPMELMHNQVTREQGLFSLRFNHASFGLYFLAENVATPTTVLDFPSLKQFETEVAKGYDYVGISFIVPNFDKARRMAELVRQVSPKSQIILGGHGTSVFDIETRITHDHLCRGEGVGFLRRLLGEDPDRPLRHPVMYSSNNRRVLGVPIADDAAILVPGVGCPNKCRFCATSHFFGAYIPFLETGRAVFEACRAAEAELGVTDFGVLDENFLKLPARAKDLIALMEEREKRYTFGIFSSAETLSALGDLDLLVRMGVTFIWLGVESKKEVYEKNRCVDFEVLVGELRRRGIAVMASAILFLEHHDRQSIWEDVDFAIGLGSDYLQFMELGPIPGTKLFADYARQGKLLPNVPFADQHGQDRIWFSHPSFTRDETREILREAFRRDYAAHGSSFLRNMRTTLEGLEYTSAHRDPRVRARAAGFLRFAKRTRPLLRASSIFAENNSTRRQVAELEAKYRALVGPIGLADRLAALAVVGMAAWEKARNRLAPGMRQPAVVTRRYRQEATPTGAGLPVLSAEGGTNG